MIRPRNARTAEIIRRMRRNTFGSIHTRINRKISMTTRIAIGCRTAKTMAPMANTSSRIESIQLFTGSGRVHRRPNCCLVPCVDRANPPPSKNAMTWTAGLKSVEAANAITAPAGTRMNVCIAFQTVSGMGSCLLRTRLCRETAMPMMSNCLRRPGHLAVVPAHSVAASQAQQRSHTS